MNNQPDQEHTMTPTTTLDALRDAADLYRTLDRLDHRDLGREDPQIRAMLAKIHEDIGDAIASLPPEVIDTHVAEAEQPTTEPAIKTSNHGVVIGTNAGDLASAHEAGGGSINLAIWKLNGPLQRLWLTRDEANAIRDWLNSRPEPRQI